MPFYPSGFAGCANKWGTGIDYLRDENALPDDEIFISEEAIACKQKLFGCLVTAC